ncbi:MAG: type II toxin-antitoxin system VapC family toxin [Planctomycetes bacterium]|nr:type II toxin-antitoxin system VapC family toxin [Planctomycetota bacterium]
MLFDTDVLIWILRGHERAAGLLDEQAERHVSVVTYMELFQGARNVEEMKQIKAFLPDLGMVMLPLTENIGHRASIYMEEYTLKVAMSMADALIAATAVENRIALCTADRRHYSCIRDLDLDLFRP